MKNFDDGKVYFPSRTDPGIEGELGRAISSLFRTKLKLFEALPIEYQKIAEAAGWHSEKPVDSCRRMRARYRNAQQAVSPSATLAPLPNCQREIAALAVAE